MENDDMHGSANAIASEFLVREQEQKQDIQNSGEETALLDRLLKALKEEDCDPNDFSYDCLDPEEEYVKNAVVDIEKVVNVEMMQLDVIDSVALASALATTSDTSLCLPTNHETPLLVPETPELQKLPGLPPAEGICSDTTVAPVEELTGSSLPLLKHTVCVEYAVAVPAVGAEPGAAAVATRATKYEDVSLVVHVDESEGSLDYDLDTRDESWNSRGALRSVAVVAAETKVERGTGGATTLQERLEQLASGPIALPSVVSCGDAGKSAQLPVATEKSVDSHGKLLSTLAVRKEPPALDPKPAMLWVSGLSISSRPTDLNTMFGKYGKVLSAVVVKKEEERRLSFHGIVSMSSVDEAAQCRRHLHGIQVRGRMLKVESMPKDYEHATSKPEQQSRISSPTRCHNADKRKLCEGDVGHKRRAANEVPERTNLDPSKGSTSSMSSSVSKVVPHVQSKVVAQGTKPDSINTSPAVSKVVAQGTKPDSINTSPAVSKVVAQGAKPDSINTSPAMSKVVAQGTKPDFVNTSPAVSKVVAQGAKPDSINTSPAVSKVVAHGPKPDCTSSRSASSGSTAVSKVVVHAKSKVAVQGPVLEASSVLSAVSKLVPAREKVTPPAERKDNSENKLTASSKKSKKKVIQQDKGESQPTIITKREVVQQREKDITRLQHPRSLKCCGRAALSEKEDEKRRRQRLRLVLLRELQRLASDNRRLREERLKLCNDKETLRSERLAVETERKEGQHLGRQRLRLEREVHELIERCQRERTDLHKLQQARADEQRLVMSNQGLELCGAAAANPAAPPVWVTSTKPFDRLSAPSVILNNGPFDRLSAPAVIGNSGPFERLSASSVIGNNGPFDRLSAPAVIGSNNGSVPLSAIRSDELYCIGGQLYRIGGGDSNLLVLSRLTSEVVPVGIQPCLPVGVQPWSAFSHSEVNKPGYAHPSESLPPPPSLAEPVTSEVWAPTACQAPVEASISQRAVSKDVAPTIRSGAVSGGVARATVNDKALPSPDSHYRQQLRSETAPPAATSLTTRRAVLGPGRTKSRRGVIRRRY